MEGEIGPGRVPLCLHISHHVAFTVLVVVVVLNCHFVRCAYLKDTAVFETAHITPLSPKWKWPWPLLRPARGTPDSPLSVRARWLSPVVVTSSRALLGERKTRSSFPSSCVSDLHADTLHYGT